MQTAGEYLRDCRERRGKTMVEVARALGISVPYLCDIELDRRPPPKRQDLREALVRESGADMARLDEIDASGAREIDVRALTPTQRAEVFALVRRLRGAA